MGPTASGKTKLAISLVQNLPLEIISVDSAMVYQGMNIGTAKPTSLELQQAPHHLIDILDPKEPYSVGTFLRDIAPLIKKINAQGKVPLLVGGTMLYFNALQKGLATLPERCLQIRDKIEQEAKNLGWPALHEKLKRIDPEAAAKIKPTDKQRIERALEVYMLTQKPISDLQKQKILMDLNILPVAIAPSGREILHERIKKRCEMMLSQGFIDEVKALKERGDLSLNMSAVRAVGYRQVWEYLEGKTPENLLLDKMSAATRQYAKRQLTWLRTFPNVIMFDSEDQDLQAKVTAKIQAFLKKE